MYHQVLLKFVKCVLFVKAKKHGLEGPGRFYWLCLSVVLQYALLVLHVQKNRERFQDEDVEGNSNGEIPFKMRWLRGSCHAAKFLWRPLAAFCRAR